MAGKFTVSLAEIIKEFNLETIYMPKDPGEILIDENDVTRPGLQLMGFYEYFNPERMQIIGKMEFAYLSTIDEETRTQRLDMLMSRHIPALIIARELPYFSEMLDLAQKYGIPLLRSKESTSNFIAGLIAFLNLNLAPRITRHGVLIEIYGEGVFITGESGVGKSETAIELVKRGHRLVADDAVEIRTSAISWNCVVSVSSTHAVCSVSAQSKIRRRSSLSWRWNSGTRKKSTTEWA